MKVIAPDSLLREAANVLAPVVDDVTVFGASAITVALHGRPAAITPTRDVDVGITAPNVDRVVTALERVGMTRSELPHEEPFTWVRGDLKVQLVRPFHPFPGPAAQRLPINNTLGELPSHRTAVAFVDAPAERRLWCATAAALVVLKAAAFGRSRHDGAPVDRDYADVILLLEHALDDIAEETEADISLGNRVVAAAQVFADTPAALEAATRQLVDSGSYETPLEARAATQRAARRAIRELGR